MVLILEVVGLEAAQLGSACRKVFGVEGGLIGRDSRCGWVLPHTKVSGRHARISHQNGVFYIEDTSTNGVFINASKSRLGKGRPYALKSGDTIVVDPYTIYVSISTSDYEEPRQRLSPPSARRSPAPRHDPFNLDDPFGEQAVPFGEQIVPPPQDLHAEPLSGQEVDPLKLLGQEAPRRQVVRKAPRAKIWSSTRRFTATTNRRRSSRRRLDQHPYPRNPSTRSRFLPITIRSRPIRRSVSLAKTSPPHW